jgi:hypothetical protein
VLVLVGNYYNLLGLRKIIYNAQNNDPVNYSKDPELGQRQQQLVQTQPAQPRQGWVSWLASFFFR